MRSWLLCLLVIKSTHGLANPQVGLPDVRLPCTLPNIGLVGGDLAESDGGGGVRTDSATECKYECDRRAQCRFWSHVRDWKINCYLKAEAGEERKLEGATTGWKGDGCGSSQEQTTKSQGLLDNSGCRLPNIAFLGADLPPGEDGDGITVRSYVECRARCRKQPACTAFTFVREWDANCFLKERRAEESEFQGAISGTLTKCEESDRQQLVRRPSIDVDLSGTRKQRLPTSQQNLRQQPSRAQSQTPSPFQRRPAQSTNPLRRPAQSTNPLRRPQTSTQRKPSTNLLSRIPKDPPKQQQSQFLNRFFTTKRPSSPLRNKRPPQLPSRLVPSAPTVPSAPVAPSVIDPHAECRFENTNFEGGGLPASEGGEGLETNGVDDCAKQCQNRGQCTHWTFVGAWKVNCYLKGSLGKKTEYEGGISGTFGADCEAINNPGSKSKSAGGSQSGVIQNGDECVFLNTNFLGGGLPADKGGQGIELKDYQACSEECQKNPACHYWTFVEKWKVNCYLKSKLGEKTEFESVAGTYGSRCASVDNPGAIGSAGEVQQIGDECIFPQTNFLGGGLPASEGGQGIETRDHQACSEACQARVQCHYWTFVEKWKVNCYLKSKLGEKTEFESVSGTYGARCSAAENPTADVSGGIQRDGDSCLFPETNFLGGGLPEDEGGQGIETIDYNACAKACRDRIQCHYWTFVEKWKVNCYLKSRLGEKTEYEAISGTFGSRCDALDPNAAPSSPAVPSLRQKSPLLALASLADNSVRVKDGAGCRFPGLNYLGGDLSPQEGGYGIETSDPDHCRRECSKRSKCSFWTHVKQWKVNCYLKEKKGPDRNFEGATSGSLFVPCDKEAEDELGDIGERRENDHECAYANTNLLGADLPAKYGGLGVASPSPEDCRLKCVQQPFCKHWVHVKDWKVSCYLKSDEATHEPKEGGVAGSVGIRCLPGATSLLSITGSSSPLLSEQTRSNSDNTKTRFTPLVITAPTNNRKDHCNYPGMNFLGGDLTDAQGGNGIEVSGPEACAAECERRSPCSYWTHVKDWKVGCYLKSTYDNFGTKEGAVSGSIGVKCQELPSTPSAPSAPRPFQPPSLPSSHVKKVPVKPVTQPDNVCFFHDTNILGGDLPRAQNGEGIVVADANACAIECYKNDKCVYWVHVSDRAANCFLKSHFTEEEGRPGATSGSIGLACN